MDVGFMDYEIFPLIEGPDKLCSGGNEKQLFLGVGGDYGADLAGFLEKIMAAVHYDVQRDALTFLLTQAAPFSFKALANKYQFQQAVFFGIKPSDAGLKLNALPFQPLQVGSIQYLFCGSLKNIQEEPNAKRQLWEALKLMFLK